MQVIFTKNHSHRNVKRIAFPTHTLTLISLSQLAGKWHALSLQEKQPYNDRFKADQERFKIEMKEFEKKQEALGETDEKISKKKKKSKGKVNGEAEKLPETSAPPQLDMMVVKKREDDVPKAFINANCELPIFTDSFLEHNKQIELELKQLRKSNVEIEQQNDVLMKHIENMDNGVKKVEGETISIKQQNTQLEKYLTKLKCILASGLNSVPLPALKTGASVENIAEYMAELTAEPTAQKSPVAAARDKARDILRKIDIPC